MHSALDGIDEYVSATDVPRRILATPRRQLPIRSMIEGDELELRWQNEVSSSSSSRNEYNLGGNIALLLQDHHTMSTKSVYIATSRW